MQIKELAEIREMRASLKAKIEAEGRKSLQPLQKAFRSFFDECAIHEDCRKNTELAFACSGEAPGKNVTAVAWTQYTPHFNDGEACVFHVRDFSWKLETPDSGFPEPAYPDSSFNEPAWDPKKRTSLTEACLEFERMLKDDEIFLAVFGDHVLVVATREGFTVTEYDHD